MDAFSFKMGGGGVSIGNHVTISSSMQANPTAGQVTKLCTNCNGEIKIGDRVGISNATIFAFDEITIETSKTLKLLNERELKDKLEKTSTGEVF